MTQVTTVSRQAAALPALSAGSEHSQFLIFTLSGEAFALDILHVKEIIEYGQLTEVPMMPDVVRGVINLRGAVVPVIDLSARFGRAPTQVARRTCIVIVELEQDGERNDVGIIVDAVNEVVEISPADIEPPPSFGTQLRTDFIAGMGKLDGRFVIVLKADQVLSLEELSLQPAQSEPAGPTQ